MISFEKLGDIGDILYIQKKLFLKYAIKILNFVSPDIIFILYNNYIVNESLNKNILNFKLLIKLVALTIQTILFVSSPVRCT